MVQLRGKIMHNTSILNYNINSCVVTLYYNITNMFADIIIIYNKGQ